MERAARLEGAHDHLNALCEQERRYVESLRPKTTNGDEFSLANLSAGTYYWRVDSYGGTTVGTTTGTVWKFSCFCNQ